MPNTHRTENLILTVDVAHPPMRQEEVEETLRAALSRLNNLPGASILKIIHGYGSSGKGGTTKEVVLNWTYKNRSRFRSVIKGEEYTPFHQDVQRLRRELGLFDDIDLRAPNPGITVCWVK